MAVTINASTSAGLIQTADTTGNLNLQSNGTTIAALTSTGLAVTGAGTFSTTLGVTGTSTLAAVNASGSILASNGGNYLFAGAAPVYIGGRSTTGDGYIGVNMKIGIGNYVVNGFAGQITYDTAGAWNFNTAASGIAGNVVSDTSKMTISNAGTVTIPGALTVSSGAVVRNVALNNGTSCGGLYPFFTLAGSGDNSPILFADTGLELHFATNGVATKRMTIDTAGTVVIPGNLQVGTAIQITTSNAPQVTPTGFYMNTWPTTASPANTNVANGNYAKLVTSLRANKTEIASISEQVATDTVMAMRGVTYRSAIDEDQREWAGFIAEETKEANPTLAMFDSLGDLQSISYDRVPAYMIPVLQKHEREIQSLRAELQQLKAPQ